SDNWRYLGPWFSCVKLDSNVCLEKSMLLKNISYSFSELLRPRRIWKGLSFILCCDIRQLRRRMTVVDADELHKTYRDARGNTIWVVDSLLVICLTLNED